MYHLTGFRIDEKYIIGKNGFRETVKIEKNAVKAVIYNREFYPFKNVEPNAYFIFPYKGANNDIIPFSVLKEKYPLLAEYLSTNKQRITDYVECCEGDFWHKFTREHNHTLYNVDKIIIPMTARDTIATFINDKGLYMDNANVWFITVKGASADLMKAITCIINSTIFTVFGKSGANPQSGGYYKFNKQFLMPIPFPIKAVTEKADCAVVDKVNQITEKDLSLNELIAIFEMLVPQSEKKKKGVVYAPEIITRYIVSNTLNCDSIPTVLDPSCGCGAFLVTAAEYMHERFAVSYTDIISLYLYGVDIDSNAIDRIKSLLSLVVLMNNEEEKCNFNFICADTLDKKTYDRLHEMCKEGFDCVVGNPPYVRNKNMSLAMKNHLTNWVSSSVGNVDLYIPFFEIGIKLLSDKGKLGYISPNSYLQGVNGRSLRKYFDSKQHRVEIIDFRDSQVFENVTSYTCITLVDKGVNTDTIKYFRLNETNTLEQHTFSEYCYADFPDGKPWRMRESSIDEVIHKLESSGTPLSNWKIRNGLATLKNDIYFFSPVKEDNKYYYREYNGKTYSIEKNICIKVAKPNIIKSEAELEQKMEIAIFPYTHTDSSYQLIEEDVFRSYFPEAYKFLTEYKSLLLNRDKGHGNYPAWYAYGRTQGMNNFGKKLLIPYISGSPVAVLSLDPDVLFYCGYALLSEDIEELKILKIFLESEAFWYYIFHTSKPYSKGYMAFAKNYIVNFTIPELSEKEKTYLLASHTREELDGLVWGKYNIQNKNMRC